MRFVLGKTIKIYIFMSCVNTFRWMWILGCVVISARDGRYRRRRCNETQWALCKVAGEKCIALLWFATAYFLLVHFSLFRCWTSDDPVSPRRNQQEPWSCQGPWSYPGHSRGSQPMPQLCISLCPRGKGWSGLGYIRQEAYDLWWCGTWRVLLFNI